jgi:hypothetical protein
MQKGKNTFKIISIGVITGIVVLVFLGACVKTNGNTTMTDPNSKKVNSHLITGWGQRFDIPISEELSKWLKSKNILMLQFIFDNGEVLISNISGEEVEPCGWVVDGEVIPDDCRNLDKIKIESLAEETTMGTKLNPKCITKKIGGYLIQVCK